MIWFYIAFISALFSAAAAIAQKKVLFSMGALQFSFLVNILNLALSIPFFLAVNFSLISTEAILILFFKSILGAFAFLCIMLALKNLEISGALPLMVLTPGFVALFAWIFLGEALTGYEILGMLLLLFGTYLLEMKPKKSFAAPLKVYLNSKFHYYIGIAILLFTISSILDKLLLSSYKMPPFAFMAFQQLFFAVIFSIMYLFKKKEQDKAVLKINKEVLLWVLVISVFTLGYRYTQIEAIKIAPVALVLAIKRISVFISASVGGRIFRDKNLIIKTAAAAIMVIGAIMILED